MRRARTIPNGTQAPQSSQAAEPSLQQRAQSYLRRAGMPVNPQNISRAMQMLSTNPQIERQAQPQQRQQRRQAQPEPAPANTDGGNPALDHDFRFFDATREAPQNPRAVQQRQQRGRNASPSEAVPQTRATRTNREQPNATSDTPSAAPSRSARRPRRSGGDAAPQQPARTEQPTEGAPTSTVTAQNPPAGVGIDVAATMQEMPINLDQLLEVAARYPAIVQQAAAAVAQDPQAATQAVQQAVRGPSPDDYVHPGEETPTAQNFARYVVGAPPQPPVDQRIQQRMREGGGMEPQEFQTQGDPGAPGEQARRERLMREQETRQPGSPQEGQNVGAPGTGFARAERDNLMEDRTANQADEEEAFQADRDAAMRRARTQRPPRNPARAASYGWDQPPGSPDPYAQEQIDQANDIMRRQAAQIQRRWEEEAIDRMMQQE